MNIYDIINVIDLTDPMNTMTYKRWTEISSKNSSIYDELDGFTSLYRCNSSGDYKNALEEFSPPSYFDEEVRTSLGEIQGFLVDWPQNLFKNEDLSPSVATRTLVPNELWV